MSRRGWLWSFLFVSLLSACTKSYDVEGPGLGEARDDDDVDASADEEDPVAGRGGRGGASGSVTAGRGGAGGRGVIGGRGGAGGRGAAGTGAAPSCGNCPEPPLLAAFIGAESCCAAGNVCGLTAATAELAECQPLAAPGEENESCPEVVIGGLLPLPGCCREDGTCGALDSILGLGCARASGGATMSCTP